ncbi:hypothetical protein T10_11182 [Trichinella papuae]|uniref:Uncharacterized protein n=1 Tax=Trichinella papuae TaxID=268474 RepID=A0A0V1MQ42_9BILA|nr:hypothetical protein T10_11182 [Trichinella papuae]
MRNQIFSASYSCELEALYNSTHQPDSTTRRCERYLHLNYRITPKFISCKHDVDFAGKISSFTFDSSTLSSSQFWPLTGQKHVNCVHSTHALVVILYYVGHGQRDHTTAILIVKEASLFLGNFHFLPELMFWHFEEYLLLRLSLYAKRLPPRCMPSARSHAVP